MSSDASGRRFSALGNQSLYHQVSKLNVNRDPAARLSVGFGEQDSWVNAGTQGRGELNCFVDLTDCSDQISTKLRHAGHMKTHEFEPSD